MILKHTVLPSSSRMHGGDDMQDDVTMMNPEEQIRHNITPCPKYGNLNNKEMSQLIYLATSKTL